MNLRNTIVGPVEKLVKLGHKLINTPVLPLMAYAPVYTQTINGQVKPEFIVGAIVATGLYAFGDYIDEATEVFDT